jgi:hypothetical protein
MKYFTLTISCAILLTLSASAQNHKELIKQKAQLMADAVVKQDYATVISYTYQPFVKAHGGRDSLVAAIKNGLMMMKARGIAIVIKKAEVSDPANEVKVGSKLYTAVPENLL